MSGRLPICKIQAVPPIWFALASHTVAVVSPTLLGGCLSGYFTGLFFFVATCCAAQLASDCMLAVIFVVLAGLCFVVPLLWDWPSLCFSAYVDFVNLVLLCNFGPYCRLSLSFV